MLATIEKYGLTTSVSWAGDAFIYTWWKLVVIALNNGMLISTSRINKNKLAHKSKELY